MIFEYKSFFKLLNIEKWSKYTHLLANKAGFKSDDFKIASINNPKINVEIKL